MSPKADPGLARASQPVSYFRMRRRKSRCGNRAVAITGRNNPSRRRPSLTIPVRRVFTEWHESTRMGFGRPNARLLGSVKKTRELRRARRRAAGSNTAWIRPDDGFGRRACRVMDLSETGVRLWSDDPVPAIFNFVSNQGGLGRRARVKWRRGREIGAEFF